MSMQRTLDDVHAFVIMLRQHTAFLFAPAPVFDGCGVIFILFTFNKDVADLNVTEWKGHGLKCNILLCQAFNQVSLAKINIHMHVWV